MGSYSTQPAGLSAAGLRAAERSGQDHLVAICDQTLARMSLVRLSGSAT